MIRNGARIAKAAFTKHLLITNTLVCGGLGGLGDFLQQKLERSLSLEPRSNDWPRTVRMTTVGLLIGPIGHVWYRFLDSTFPGNSKMTVLKKLALEQALVSPSLLLGFFIGMGTLEGKSLKLCIDEIKEKFVFVYLVDCLFWPPVQAVNFYFLPSRYRVLYVSLALLIWNVFLSYIKHKDANVPNKGRNAIPGTSKDALS